MPDEEVDAFFVAVQQSRMNAVPPVAQNPDVRFLGRLLGDVIRAYGG